MFRLFIAALALLIAGSAAAQDSSTTAPQTTTKAVPVTIAKTKTTTTTTTTKDKAMMQIDQAIAAAKVDKSKSGWRTSLAKPAVATFDPAHSYFARMVTNKGTVLISSCPRWRRCT